DVDYTWIRSGDPADRHPHFEPDEDGVARRRNLYREEPDPDVSTDLALEYWGGEEATSEDLRTVRSSMQARFGHYYPVVPTMGLVGALHDATTFTVRDGDRIVGGATVECVGDDTAAGEIVFGEASDFWIGPAYEGRGGGTAVGAACIAAFQAAMAQADYDGHVLFSHNGTGAMDAVANRAAAAAGASAAYGGRLEAHVPNGPPNTVDARTVPAY
ncbi:MAG: hypothetical protein ABEK12_02210, partial [Candidatus Nanohaloarchaea archaeon]